MTPQEEKIAATVLDLVTTIPEICRRWQKTRKSVEMRIYRDDIAAVQAGNIWLVYIPSVRAIWGDELTESEK